MLNQLKALFSRWFSNPPSVRKGLQLQPFAPTYDLGPLADAGANLVRYQVRVHNAEHRPPAEFLEAIKQECIPHLLSTLTAADALGIQVAVCVMTPPGGQQLFTTKEYEQALIGSWMEIVQAVKNAGLRRAVYGWDLLNEPATTADRWNAMVTNLRGAIRSIDGARPIIVSAPYGDPTKLRGVRILRDNNVIYTFHHYWPLKFTHQGVYEFPVGIVKPSKAKIWDHLQGVKDWQQQNGNPRVYVGEFSCVRWAPEEAARDYLRESLLFFEDAGWDWTYHAWREWHGWSLEHDGNKDNPWPVGDSSRKRLIFRWLSDAA